MGVASRLEGTRRLRDAETNEPLILDYKPLCICYYANVRCKNKCIEQHMDYLVRKELLPSKLGKYKMELHTKNVIEVCKSSFPLSHYTALFHDRQQRHITLLILLQPILPASSYKNMSKWAPWH